MSVTWKYFFKFLQLFEIVTNLLICLHRREPLVEGELVDLGESLRKNLEGGRLDDDVASLEQVEDQLDVEEAATCLGREVGGESGYQLSVSDGLAVPDVGDNPGRGSHPASHVVSQVLGEALVGVGVVEAHPVERQLPGQLLLVRADCAEELEPGWEVVEVLCQEAGQGVAIVRPQLVGFAEPVDHDHADLGRVDLALASQVGERLEDALDQGGGGVGVAGGEGEQRLHLGLALDQLEVGRELRSLRHLGSNGVDELWDEAGGGVVRLAEVVGHQVGGKLGEVVASLVVPLVRHSTTLAKAAGFDQGQDHRGLASAWIWSIGHCTLF